MSKPLFTTKHYKAIAEVLEKVWRSAKGGSKVYVGDVVWDFEVMLRRDNPKFGTEKFIKLINKS